MVCIGILMKRNAAIDPIPYSPPLTKEDLLTKAINERQAYDNAGEIVSSPLEVALHNIKRRVDPKAMLKRNDTELNQLFGQGIPLDDAPRIRQNRWDRIPDTARDAGVILGIAAGQ